MSPTIRQLEYAVAVAEALSFRRAAERCCVSQPSLSSQIQELERSLGVQLFERDRRRVMVTSEGEKLVDSARQILASVQDLVDSAQSFRDPLSGGLRLGVIPTIAPYLLPESLPRLRRRFPELHIRVCEEQTHRLVELAMRGRLDVLLVALEADLGELETEGLFDDDLVVVLPSAHRLARRKTVRQGDLEGEEILLLGEGHCLREQTESICAAVGACEPADVSAASLHTLVHMVAHGTGTTLLPSIAVSNELRGLSGVEVRPFVKPAPTRTVGLAWRRSSSRAEAFNELGKVFADVAKG